MAVSVKKKGSDTVTMASLLTMFQKDKGDAIGNFGGTLSNTDRVPTGIFELDLAMGGGFPRGKCSMIYGQESAGKTNIALLTIANHQKLFPHLTCAFVDIEHSWDPEWAAKLGVDVEKVMVLHPEYAEQCVDLVEAMLGATDCGIVVIDSIAAFVTASELEASADTARVGGASQAIAKLVRKTTLAMSEAAKEGRRPTLIYINQITYKIGVMFGDPETTPGGPKPRHQSAMTLRVYGKNVINKAVSPVMPVGKDTSVIIRKWKVPVLAASTKFVLVTIAHNNLQVGTSDDVNSVLNHLSSLGVWQKHEKKGYVCFDEHYPTIDAFKKRYRADFEFGSAIRKGIIERAVQELGLESGGDDKT